jgi:hypothetical protein
MAAGPRRDAPPVQADHVVDLDLHEVTATADRSR